MESPKSESFKNFPRENLPEYYYEHLMNVLQIIDTESFYNPELIEKTIKIQVNPNQIDNKLAYLIYWIGNPLREEIFQEMCILICILRKIILQDIWFEKVGMKQKLFTSEQALKEKISEVKCINPNSNKNKEILDLNLKRILEKKRYPVILENLMTNNNMKNVIDYIQILTDNTMTIFLDKLDQYCKNDHGNDIEDLVEKILYYKEKELINYNDKLKFQFFSKDNNEDLKQLLHLLSEWMKNFDENDLKLCQVDLDYKIEDQCFDDIEEDISDD